MQFMVSAIIIDDEKDIVSLLVDLLELIDVKVVGTGNDGEKAIELYKKFQPDIIFLDMKMPKYDGFYAIEELKKIQAKTKFIIVSAGLEDKTLKKLKELEVDTMLQKPYTIEQIEQKITDELKIQL